MLGITYKSAWFMVHRIRHAMTQFGAIEPMTGTVEVDEAYIGGRRRGEGSGRGKPRKTAVVTPRRNGRLAIPLPFEEAVKKALKAKPPEKPERKPRSRPKRAAKR
jgi:hypothetical protein